MFVAQVTSQTSPLRINRLLLALCISEVSVHRVANLANVGHNQHVTTLCFCIK
jgi:hypothetical protein